MIKLVTIIGARPQIIKAAALSRVIRNEFSDKITEVLVHTGQHYDENMSQVFFDELGIPAPDYNLNVGSGSHGKQTASMITGIEAILEKEKPQFIVLYGDTNSTLAGCIAASKLHVQIVHIEAGLRSFNKMMPEEVNRILCDHVSTLLFAPTQTGFDNLVKEGFNQHAKAPYSADNPKIYHCGDIMYDNSIYFSNLADEKTSVMHALNLKSNNFILATIHRNNNTDQPERLTALFSAMLTIANEQGLDIVIPVHPRTEKLLEVNLPADLYAQIKINPSIKLVPPVSFLEMIALEKNCKLVMTDSGGVQKEAFFFKKPCIILRSETEWVELVNCGSAIIVGADEQLILEAFKTFNAGAPLNFPPVFGDGHAARFMLQEMIGISENSKNKAALTN